MDIETQEKVSRLIREQADKLGIALKALRKVRDMQHIEMYKSEVQNAVDVATEALRQIGDHGKNPEDL